MTGTAFRRLWIGLIALLVAVIIGGSLWPMGVPSIDAGLDKFEHFFSYLVLMLFSSGIVAPERLWRLSIRCFLLGLGLELAQAFWTETRQGDWVDLLVNTAGILTAWAMVGGGRAGWAQKLESWLARRRQT